MKRLKTKASVVRWSLVKCLKEAKKHKDKKEWRSASPSSYAAANKNGWMTKCAAHMPDKKKYESNEDNQGKKNMSEVLISDKSRTFEEVAARAANDVQLLCKSILEKETQIETLKSELEQAKKEIASLNQTPNKDEEYLTTDELANRLKYDSRTIRNTMVDKVLLEGKHYVRPFNGRKILFKWNVIERDMGSYHQED